MMADRDCAGTCPGGDLSLWGFGESSDEEMAKVCRPLKVEVFSLADERLLESVKWRPAKPAVYKGLHGMVVVEGEGRSAGSTDGAF